MGKLDRREALGDYVPFRLQPEEGNPVELLMFAPLGTQRQGELDLSKPEDRELLDEAWKAHVRLERLEASLDLNPEFVQHIISDFAETGLIRQMVAPAIAAALIEGHIAKQASAGKPPQGEVHVDYKKLDQLKNRIAEALLPTLETKAVTEDLAYFLWVNLQAWVTESIEAELGRGLDELSKEERAKLAEAYWAGNVETIGKRVDYLRYLYAREVARHCLEAINFSKVALPDMEALLGGAPLPNLATIPVPSNPIVTNALLAMWSGGPKFQQKGRWKLNPNANSAELRRRAGGSGELLFWVDPKLEAEAAVWTMQQIESYLKGLSALTSDVALAVLACLTGAKKAPMLEPVAIDADKIIRQKNIEAWGQQRAALRVAIEREMENLQRLRFEVFNLPANDPDTGKWNARGYSWKNDRLFDIIEVKEYQHGLFGERETIATKWSVRAGQWAYYFLSPQARQWICSMAKVLLQLSHREDRRVEVLAKKIGQHLMLHKFRLAKGQDLEWTIRSLCESIGESPEAEDKPGRFRTAFENALKVLMKERILKRVEYPPGYGMDVTDHRGWVQPWLENKLVFTLPSTQETETLVTEADKTLAPALPAPRHRRAKRRGPVINGLDVRRTREERYWHQETLAKHLGISRRYLSDIENNKRLPSPELAKKVHTWLQQKAE